MVLVNLETKRKNKDTRAYLFQCAHTNTHTRGCSSRPTINLPLPLASYSCPIPRMLRRREHIPLFCRSQAQSRRELLRCLALMRCRFALIIRQMLHYCYRLSPAVADRYRRRRGEFTNRAQLVLSRTPQWKRANDVRREQLPRCHGSSPKNTYALRG